MRIYQCILMALAIFPNIAWATPPQYGVRTGANVGGETRDELLLRRTFAQIGVTLGVGLIVGGSLAAYSTSRLCVDYPDPADDCGVAQSLASVGTGVLLTAGTLTLVWAAFDWAGAQADLDSIELLPAVSVAPDANGAIFSLSGRF